MGFQIGSLFGADVEIGTVTSSLKSSPVDGNDCSGHGVAMASPNATFSFVAQYSNDAFAAALRAISTPCRLVLSAVPLW